MTTNRSSGLADTMPGASWLEPAWPSQLDAVEQHKVLVRLKRIEGQLRGVVRMVNEDRACLEVLQQLASVEAGLSGASTVVFRSYVEGSIANGSGSTNDQQRFMLQLLDIMHRFAKLRHAAEPVGHDGGTPETVATP